MRSESWLRLMSGLVLAGPGYRSLGVIGGALVALPVIALLARGRRATALITPLA